jgi:tape measure domain-containing protein
VAETQIKITADTRSAERDIENLNKRLSSIEKSSLQAQKGLDLLGTTTRLAVGAMAALTASIGVREIVDYTARWTDLNSRLINATGSQAAAKEALDAISASARGTYSSLEKTAEVFVRNSMALNELGYTTNEQIKISTALNNAMAVSGARGEQAASALDAFSKAVARGKMEGEDFNRIIENAPELVKALADGLGVTTGEFRKMITEGTITSDVMIPALLSQMDKLQKKADEMPATISDAFVVLQNSLFKFIGSMDEALGISQALSKALVFVADNTGVMVGAIAGLAVAVAALLIPLIPAATAMAVLTGGAAVLGAVALGAALGYAAQQAGVFGDNTKKALDPLKQQKQAAEDAAAAAARAANAAKKLVEEQNKGLKPLFDKLQLEKESLGLSQTEIAVKKNIAEAAKALKIEEDKISASVRKRIEDETRSLELAKQKVVLDKVIQDYATEMISLLVADKNEREIILAIRKQELDFGRDLTATEKERLTNTIAVTQALRERAAITQAITDATRDQTELEKIQRGLGLQKTLGGPAGGGFVTSEKEYQRDQEALKALLDRKILSEQQYYQQREELARQYNLKIQEIELQRIERVLAAEASGVAKALSTKDQEILQKQGKSEREKAIAQDRIDFEKKSDLEKTQFALTNMQSVFSALGAQNKKAFEASKALAIASALVNTYQGATKALATYPFPFGLIAAAAAVAAGMAQVAAIRSQQYSGRALGGPVMGGQSYIVGESGPELFTPQGTGSITRNSDLGGGSPVNVNFTIVANDTQGFDQLLTSRQGVIKQIISDAMLERGSRSIV